MQTALTLRKSSINSIAATFAVLLALTLGGAGGYLLKGQVSAALTTVAPASSTIQIRQKGLGHDMPDYGVTITDAADRAAAAGSARNPSVVVGHDYDH
jgi:hypothetical protein